MGSHRPPALGTHDASSGRQVTRCLAQLSEVTPPLSLSWLCLVGKILCSEGLAQRAAFSKRYTFQRTRPLNQLPGGSL